MQQVAPVQSALSQAGSQVPAAFSQTAPMAAVVLPGGTAAMPVAAGKLTSNEATTASPVAPALVGASVDVDEFTRASKGGASAWLGALFASKPRVAGVFFVLGVLITLGAQAIFGSDAKTDAALGRDEAAEPKSQAKAPAAAKAEDKADKADKADEAAEKPEDKVEPTPAAAASAEPAPEAEEPASAATKSTKTSASTKFNKTAATKAMSSAASRAARCKAGGKGGPAKVTATFAPSGKVSLVQIISGRFDSKTLGCIRNAFQAARVPAFTGKPEAVTKSFTVK
jgi:hypothetical protein